MRHHHLVKIFWILGVILGLTYWLGAMARSGVAFHGLAVLDFKFVVIWKLLSAGFLALCVVTAAWAARSKPAIVSWPMILLASAFGVIVLADYLLALKHVTLSGFVFIIAHILAICAYYLAREKRPIISRLRQTISGLSILLPGLIVIMAGVITKTTDLSPALAVFPVFSALAASFALRSHFPVYLTGLGSVIFMMSDVSFVLGSLSAHGAAHVGWVVWICYFAGLALMARGAAQYAATADLQN